ncbi:MAG: RHS repeat-associated core domain-containing protein, partial [bacterium]
QICCLVKNNLQKGCYTTVGGQQGTDNGVVFIDLTGSGLPDIIQHVRWNPTISYKGAWLNRAKKLPDYLISITDGFDAKITIDYESLSNKKTEVYTKEHNAKYPNMDWQGPMYVVYETASEAASNDTNSKNNRHITNYHYTGAKVNHLGLGFLGFHKVTTTDQSTGINTTITYSQDINLHNKGMPMASETRRADGTLISSSQDNWDLKIFNNYYSPYVKQSIKKTYQLDGALLSTATLDNTFDDYANPLKIISSIQDATTNETYTTTTENTYHNDSQKWFIGELITAKVIKAATGRLTQTRTSNFSYDPETSLLMQTIAEPDDLKLALTTKYERDVFGNIISTTVSGNGIDSRTAKVKYDDFGRFIIQTTNPLGQSTYKTIDPRFGVVTESIDLNGLKTTYQYDDFTRLVEQINSDSAKTDVSYSWFNPASIPTEEIKNTLKNCSYVITSYTKNSTTQNEYYDVLSRKVASTTQNMDGKTIWQLTHYDELGRVTQTTAPFFAGDPVYYTKMQYDILGRVIQSTLPDGSLTQIIYDGFTTTAINQLRQKQIKQVNAIGELAKTIDNLDSATTYKYDAYSNMVAMIDCEGNLSKIEYDNLGRKIAIDDKDKGYWVYQYDVLGNLVSQTDALKNTTTFKYDKLGRMINRTEYAGADQASISTWKYDIQANGIGKLAEVSSVVNNPILIHRARYNGLEAYTRSYSYDHLGRISQENANVADKDQTYIKNYTYDASSRIDIETYPNKLQVKNSYNELGYLVQISDAQTGKVYWSLNAKDAAGHVISESHSNGLITNYTYDPKTNFLIDIDTVLSMPLLAQKKLLPEFTGVTASHKHIDLAIQKETFNYDLLGNIKTHQDVVNNSLESFQYDGLNRVIKADNNEKEALVLHYDTLGNITYKSDVGAYKYGENGAGHHAVTSISGKYSAKFQYNANGDQVNGSLNGDRSITYTSYSKPLTIKTLKANVRFLYDADYQKISRFDETHNKTAMTFYLGNYEEVIIDNGKLITTEQKAYIGPNTIHIKKEDSTEIYEALHNNLGSVTDITDANANVVQHFSYTPFGERKQTKGVVPFHPVTNKGFTGHETIEGVNLIHMEGRVYDPVVGRFLSADPFVQDSSNSQCLNRYSYCVNNPIAFTDPTGFFNVFHWVEKNVLRPIFHFVQDVGQAIWNGVKNVGEAIGSGIKSALKNPYVAAFAGVAIGIVTSGLGLGWVATAACMSGYSGVATLTSGGSLRDAFMVAGLNFATVAIWRGAGTILSQINSIGFDKFVAHSLVHGMVGGGVRAIEGGSFKDGFLAASVAAVLPVNSIGGVEQSRMLIIAERTLAAGVVGGTVAAVTGGNFANGTTTAAYAELFNDLGHLGAETMRQYASKEALKMAMGPNSVVAAMRPIDFPGLNNFMYSNNWTHEHHLDVAHEQIFWTGPAKSDGGFDLSNLGSVMFGGVVSDGEFSNNILDYKFSRIIYHNVPQTNNAAQMQQTLNSAKNGMYSLFTNNCQHLKQNGYLGMGLAPQ